MLPHSFSGLYLWHNLLLVLFLAVPIGACNSQEISESQFDGQPEPQLGGDFDPDQAHPEISVQNPPAYGARLDPSANAPEQGKQDEAGIEAVPAAPELDQTPVVDLTPAYERLVRGEFFHNIPDQFQVNEPVVISAGIAEHVTEEVLDSINIEGPVSIEQGVLYDPLGVELQLSGNPENIRIEEISSGRKAVITDYPDVWEWNVTPLKEGRLELKLEAVVTLATAEVPSQQDQMLVTQVNIPVRANVAEPNQVDPGVIWRTILILGSVISFSLLGCLVSRYYHAKARTTVTSEVSIGNKE